MNSRRLMGPSPQAEDNSLPHRFWSAVVFAGQQNQLTNVRFGSKADILRCGKERRYSITSSARWKCNTQLVGGLEVDQELHFRDLLDRQIARTGASENFPDIDAHEPVSVRKVWSV